MPISIRKINNSWIHLSSEDRSLEMDLKGNFTFKAPNYQHSPKYKARIWDGTISLYNIGSKRIPAGLLPHIIGFCIRNKYDYVLDDALKVENTQTDVTREEIKEFVESLNVHSRGEKIIARDYQLECIYQTIKQKRIVNKVPTSGGKSFIIYCVMRWLLEKSLRFVLIVPTVALVNQMLYDFKDYSSHNGFSVEKNTHKLYSGEAKEFIKPILISTWQSINAVRKANKKLFTVFNTYDAVCIDEAHQAKSTALNEILSEMTNVEFRFGTTGTIDNTKINKLSIESNLGPIYTAITTKELIDRKEVSQLTIKALVLKYPVEEAKAIKGLDYQTQEDYVTSHPARTNFITNLACSTDGPTLVLCSKVEKHAIPLYESIKAKSKRPVYLVVGKVDADAREEIRLLANKEDCIIVASYGTMSTGVSIPNLRYVLFASSTRSMTRVCQSIGRGLRLANGKITMILIDIVDNLSYKKKMNFAMEHFEERLKIYQEEKFVVNIKEITL